MFPKVTHCSQTFPDLSAGGFLCALDTRNTASLRSLPRSTPGLPWMLVLDCFPLCLATLAHFCERLVNLC